MTFFNVSYAATQSLKAIDNWLSTCQANVTGSVRTSFKESILTYGGSNTIVNRAPKNFAAGEMIAEQTLKTGDTRVKWEQGDIQSVTPTLADSTNPDSDTNFAIQGDGFFAVVDLRTIRAQPANSGNPAFFAQRVAGKLSYGAGANQGDVYLTRDGQFHFAIIPAISTTDAILVDRLGNAVLADAGPGFTDNIYHFLQLSNFLLPPTLNHLGAFNRERPSVVQPTYDAAAGTPPASIIDYNELQYSKYGSTYYNAPTALSVKTIINGTDNNYDRRDPANQPSGSMLWDHSLEASNTDQARNLTEMAALGKMYNGFVQMIKAYNGTLDEILGFIR
jgi:flagellar basal body rod protein FlgG